MVSRTLPPRAAFRPPPACVCAPPRQPLLAQHPTTPSLLRSFAPRCAALRGIRDDIEKEHAFLGLCALLRLNPQVSAGGGGSSKGPPRVPHCMPAWGRGSPTDLTDRGPCLPAPCLQGAGGCFTGLCEAIVSWQRVACEGLHNELIQLMQASPGRRRRVVRCLLPCDA